MTDFPSDPKQHDIEQGLARLGEGLMRHFEPGRPERPPCPETDHMDRACVYGEGHDLSVFPHRFEGPVEYLEAGDVIAPGAFGTEPQTVPLTDRPGGEVIGEATVQPDGTVEAEFDPDDAAWAAMRSWEVDGTLPPPEVPDVLQIGTDGWDGLFLARGNPVPPWSLVHVGGEWHDDEWVGSAGLVTDAPLRPMTMFERVQLVLDRHADDVRERIRLGADYEVGERSTRRQRVDDVFAAIGHDPRGADSTCYALPELYDQDAEPDVEPAPDPHAGLGLQAAARMLAEAVRDGAAEVRSAGSDGSGRTIWRVTGLGPNIVHFGQAHVREATRMRWLVVGNGGVLQASSLLDDEAGS